MTIRRCTRPEWSNEQNDYCDCDNPNYYAAQETGYNPCDDCIYMREEEL